MSVADKYSRCVFFLTLSTNRTTASPPPLYKDKLDQLMMPEVSFRITAIRETFEESGLLLARHFKENYFTPEDIMKWRNIVHKDATQVRLEFIRKVCIWNVISNDI